MREGRPDEVRRVVVNQSNTHYLNSPRFRFGSLREKAIRFFCYFSFLYTNLCILPT